MRYKKTIISILVFLSIFIFWVVNNFFIITKEVTLSDFRINEEVKIAFMGDLHGYNYPFDNSAILDKLIDYQPDFVFYIGDMHTRGDDSGMEVAIKLMGETAELFPTYFVAGEHDNTDYYLERLEAVSVVVLAYDNLSLEIDGRDTGIELYGINNVYYSPTFDLANEFTIDESRYNILLAHMENFESFADFGIDLTLAADTHGGQVQLPFIGPVYHEGSYFPTITQSDKAIYDKGLFEISESKLYVTSGVGSTPAPIRVFNPPEIVFLTLNTEEIH